MTAAELLRMLEPEIIDLIARELDTRLQERGVVIPRRPKAKLPGAGAGTEGTAYVTPDSTSPNSIVMSDGEGNWNEYPHVGPVS